VLAGADRSSFVIQTHPVLAETVVVIRASGAGAEQSARLTLLPVTPSAAAPEIGVAVGDPVGEGEAGRLGSPRPAEVLGTPGDKTLDLLDGLGAGPLSEEDRD